MSQREKVRKNGIYKLLIWIPGVTIVVLVMFYFDSEKVYKEEKPPIPIVTLGEQQTQVVLGSYTWNNGEVKREFKDLTESLKFDKKEYSNRLHINFQEGEEPVYISRGVIGRNGTVKYELTPMLSDNSVEFLSNYPSIMTLSLKAFWKNGKHAEYIVPLNVHTEEKRPNANYLPFNKGYHSLMIVADEEYDSSIGVIEEIQDEIPHFLMEYRGPIPLEMAQEQYPELQLKNTPTYLLFGQEREVLRTESLGILKNYIKENTFVTRETIKGVVTGLNRELGVLYIDDFPYSLVEISVKVGDQIQFDMVTLNKENPSQKVIDNLFVVEKANKSFKQKEWLSKEHDKYSLLVVGNSDFIKPFNNPHKGDLKMVGKISLKKTLHSIKQPSIFVFNKEELVYQTHDYSSLLRYLFEMEQVSPNES